MKNYIIVCMLAVVMAGCAKDTVTAPEFDVTTESTTYKVGDKVNFNITGNPGILSFYSGELSNDYGFIDGRILPSKLIASFNAQVIDGVQRNQIRVRISTDFSGTHTMDDINAANWTDVTSRFAIPTSAGYIPSGDVDLSDLIVEGRPLYFALYYISQPQATAGRYARYQFTNFLLRSVTDLGSTTLRSQSATNWTLTHNGLWAAAPSTVTGAAIILRGDANNTQVQDVWAISLPVNASNTFDAGPDRAIGIKAVPNPALPVYTYTFTKAGTYKVTFVAANADINDRKELVKQLDLTITP
jgi:hypothetical protein